MTVSTVSPDVIDRDTASAPKRIAAFCMTSGFVSIATVNTLGTLTRMFSDDKAPRRGTSI